ncbi:hypothetical protein BJX99DRAFT_264392 [Aspergillus californicus]
MDRSPKSHDNQHEDPLPTPHESHDLRRPLEAISLSRESPDPEDSLEKPEGSEREKEQEERDATGEDKDKDEDNEGNARPFQINTLRFNTDSDEPEEQESESRNIEPDELRNILSFDMPGEVDLKVNIKGDFNGIDVIDVLRLAKPAGH